MTWTSEIFTRSAWRFNHPHAKIDKLVLFFLLVLKKWRYAIHPLKKRVVLSQTLMKWTQQCISLKEIGEVFSENWWFFASKKTTIARKHRLIIYIHILSYLNTSFFQIHPNNWWWQNLFSHFSMQHFEQLTCGIEYEVF